MRFAFLAQLPGLSAGDSHEIEPFAAGARTTDLLKCPAPGAEFAVEDVLPPPQLCQATAMTSTSTSQSSTRVWTAIAVVGTSRPSRARTRAAAFSSA